MSQKKNSIVSWIKTILKKNDNMENNIETVQETTQETKIFQWKKGENFGKVVEVEKEDSEFYVFTDGSRIFKNMVEEFMEEVNDVNDLPLPPTTIISLPSKDKKDKKVQDSKQTVVQNVVQESFTPVEKSPLENLIIKLSSKNVETLNLNLGINLPKKEVFDMLLENSDESKDEMIKTISTVVTSQIQIDKLQSYINEQVIIFLNNYYNESNS